jgi:hypothetical protein
LVDSVDSLGGACKLVVDSDTISLTHPGASLHSGRELRDVARVRLSGIHSSALVGRNTAFSSLHRITKYRAGRAAGIYTVSN